MAVTSLYLCQIHVDMKRSLPKCNSPLYALYLHKKSRFLQSVQKNFEDPVDLRLKQSSFKAVYPVGVSEK